MARVTSGVKAAMNADQVATAILDRIYAGLGGGTFREIAGEKAYRELLGYRADMHNDIVQVLEALEMSHEN